MSASWSEYRIGNLLRGYLHFKARTVTEAWRKGCKMFNRWMPTERGFGRIISLELDDPTPVLTTQWMIDQMKLPKKKRVFSNHSLPTVGYRVIASGSSTEDLVDPPKKKKALASPQKK